MAPGALRSPTPSRGPLPTSYASAARSTRRPSPSPRLARGRRPPHRADTTETTTAGRLPPAFTVPENATVILPTSLRDCQAADDRARAKRAGRRRAAKTQRRPQRERQTRPPRRGAKGQGNGRGRFLLLSATVSAIWRPRGVRPPLAKEDRSPPRAAASARQPSRQARKRTRRTSPSCTSASRPSVRTCPRWWAAGQEPAASREGKSMTSARMKPRSMSV